MFLAKLTHVWNLHESFHSLGGWIPTLHLVRIDPIYWRLVLLV